MDVTIREAVADDLNPVAALFKETYDFHFRSAPEIFADADAGINIHQIVAGIMANPEAVLLIAMQGDAPVGVSHIRIETLPPETGFRHLRYAKIADLVVTKSQHSRGIGKALMAASEAWASQHGLHTIQLMVWDFNTRAQSFYERLGFSPMSNILWKTIS